MDDMARRASEVGPNGELTAAAKDLREKMFEFRALDSKGNMVTRRIRLKDIVGNSTYMKQLKSLNLFENSKGEVRIPNPNRGHDPNCRQRAG